MKYRILFKLKDETSLRMGHDKHGFHFLEYWRWDETTEFNTEQITQALEYMEEQYRGQIKHVLVSYLKT